MRRNIFKNIFNKNKNLMKKSTIKPKNKVDFRQKTVIKPVEWSKFEGKRWLNF